MTSTHDRPMATMPTGYMPYRQTPVFSQETVPKGLTREHKTAADTWACIVVTSGELKYEITEPGQEAKFILRPDKTGVIMAEQPHHISIIGDVSFYVEFYKQATEST